MDFQSNQQWKVNMIEKEGNEIEVLEKNQLIVGNDDSILLFGCEAQQQLRNFQRQFQTSCLIATAIWNI